MLLVFVALAREHHRETGASALKYMVGQSRAALDARDARKARKVIEKQCWSTGGMPCFVAAIDNAQMFGRGRDLAAWLGLVPRQMTTGGKPRLLGISKRGNGYLRKMLIHGARAAPPTLSKGQTILGSWLRTLLARAHFNKVVVALAAKMARVIWSVLRDETAFELAVAGDVA